mmetsp:Transcript_3993/g.6246  ORF Transcript_3993/g.6246 Transcript_3993/m.6246 type:complete len:213 (+) Transcript_3993:3281-3919(+)
MDRSKVNRRRIQTTVSAQAGNGRRNNATTESLALQQTTIASAFTPPDNDLAIMWLGLAPILCCVLGVAIDLICGIGSFINSWRARKRMEGLEVQMDERRSVEGDGSIPGGVGSDTQMLKQGTTEAPRDVFGQLQNQGLMTSSDVERCRDLATNGDPRILGALDSHERSVMRTAVLFKKLVGGRNGNGNGNGNGSQGGSSGTETSKPELQLAI